MANGSASLSRTRSPDGESISASVTARPPASSRNGQAFKAFDVTPPPHAFASPAGRPSNRATRAPPRASLSAAKEPAGPAPTMSTSNFSDEHVNFFRQPSTRFSSSTITTVLFVNSQHGSLRQPSPRLSLIAFARRAVSARSLPSLRADALGLKSSVVIESLTTPTSREHVNPRRSRRRIPFRALGLERKSYSPQTQRRRL